MGRAAETADRVVQGAGMTGTPRGELMQIGQVAERTRLSLRTIRFYEENGLVAPATRSEGGFRVYSEKEVARLAVVRRMKPLGFNLDEMQRLLPLLADRDTGPGDRAQLVDRLQDFHRAATDRVTALQDQLTMAGGFADTLDGHLRGNR